MLCVSTIPDRTHGQLNQDCKAGAWVAHPYSALEHMMRASFLRSQKQWEHLRRQRFMPVFLFYLRYSVSYTLDRTECTITAKTHSYRPYSACYYDRRDAVDHPCFRHLQQHKTEKESAALQQLETR